MKYLFFLLCIVHLANGQTKSIKFSAPISKASPASVGLSAERLERITDMCEEAVSKEIVPGMVALIARKGKIAYHRAFGTASARSEDRLAEDDIFRIASQSKAITATAVMILWEQGKFRLDDPIARYIPEFANTQVLSSFRYADTSYQSIPAKQAITIRHLLTHTSGLGYGVIDGDERMQMIYAKAGITDLFTTKPITIKESVLKLAQLPLHHHPGEKYTYSEGLDVLGYLVEVISGLSFADFLRTHLFDPLGMDDTYFYLPQEKADRLVSIQTKENGHWTNFPTTFYDPDYPIKGAKTFYSGGAGLSSTASDYATFLQMYLNEGEYGGVRILSRTTIEMMMANQIGDLLGDVGRHYGLAFGIVDDRGQAMGGAGSKGTFDWGGYFNTQYFADPNEEVIGILMKQTRNIEGDYTGWKFRQLVFQTIDD